MNLQLALDRLTRSECFQILKETESSVDWIEIGTGVIKEYGLQIVREIKAVYPNKIIVADMKTCDAGKYEAIQAFEAGADITTVMAFSADKTIKDTIEVAKQYSKRIMIDLLGISQRTRLVELEELGVKLVSLHFGKDMQLESELHTEIFELLQGFSNFEVAVAGGINLENLPLVLKYKPDTVIVGSAITKAENPSEAASNMKGMMKAYESNY
ncbi:3-hexulose-6-phosphate synthase [Aeribacillus pallidus]|uniref:3-hexulose-6-phosphate synthase n=1 Tax=Aeribacillus pallidus TaxID=33936 RepID=A0A223E3P1_9BACI|nr:3-hexulose-6-phosphate synthase [Aeribacillus pallidus]ASS89878.1 Fe-S cluster assembly protein HesB [Aeribacillus pallidus]